MDFFKSLIKKKIQKAAFEYLKNLRQGHSKVKDIMYDVLETQPYLTSPIFSDEETELLYSLRTRTADHFKANFRNQYGGKVDCPLKCWGEDEQPSEDTQQHLLSCAKLKQEINTQDLATENVKYEHLFGSTVQQKEATVLFKRLLDARKLLQSNPPGEKLDLSMVSCQCYSDAFFTTYCIECITIGK